MFRLGSEYTSVLTMLTASTWDDKTALLFMFYHLLEIQKINADE